MTELAKYVENLFSNQEATVETEKVKQEILEKLEEKQADLMAKGLSKKEALKLAKESIDSFGGLVKGNQLTYVNRYHLQCLQTVVFNCVIVWLLSLPLLFVGLRGFTYFWGFVTLVEGLFYFAVTFCKRGEQDDLVAFVNVTNNIKRRRNAWIIWGIFFVICWVAITLILFGGKWISGNPIEISGPYELASRVVMYYLPLLTIVIPISFSNFTKILLRNEKRND